MFFLLGLTSFGGPMAHIGYLHNKFVQEAKWFTEKEFFELVSICQFFPGPTSSQVVYAIGLIRSGFFGGLFAWLGFILPSAFLMIAFAYGVNILSLNTQLGFMQGFISVSVPVVALALWQMGKSLCFDMFHWFVVIITVIMLIRLESGFGHLLVILFGAVSGLIFKIQKENFDYSSIQFSLGKELATFLATSFFILLTFALILPQIDIPENLKLFANLYKSGALVFGGGHVALPLLEADFVTTSLLTKEQFLVGYGAAQGIPGPLFSFVSYGGTLMYFTGSNMLIAMIFGFLCLLCIYLPTFLLIPSVLWFWSSVRESDKIRAALSGVNAAVFGLLLHAFIFHILPFSLNSGLSALLVFIGLILLGFLKLPSWTVVLTLGSLGGFFYAIGN